MIPVLDLKKQIAPIREEIDAAIKKVLDNANFILGEEIAALEDEIKRYVNVKYAAGVSNGTDAIRLGLIASGVKQGEAVICPAFTYYATAGAISAIGARPVFSDIDPDTYNISVESIEKTLRQKKKLNIKAIIPVHLYGQCADMDNILKIAREHKLKVIEDTAQAFGAEYKGRKAGTIGDCAALSFFPGKNLGAFGDAGMVLTNNRAIDEKIRMLRNQGNKDKYHHLILGHNNRMDTIQAAALRVNLKYLDAWNRKRRENAQYFNRRLGMLKIRTPFVANYNIHTYHQYVLGLDISSKGLKQYLKDKGIDARVFYPLPLHLQKCFKFLNYKKGDFPNSERASARTLAIPVYPSLSKKELDYIVNSIKEFLE